MLVRLPAHTRVSWQREGRPGTCSPHIDTGVQQPLEPPTPGTENERIQGDREASSQGAGQGEARTEEEDRGRRKVRGTVPSTAHPGKGLAVSAVGGGAELYWETQHSQI